MSCLACLDWCGTTQHLIRQENNVDRTGESLDAVTQIIKLSYPSLAGSSFLSKMPTSYVVVRYSSEHALHRLHQLHVVHRA